jgi:hypothetical protein
MSDPNDSTSTGNGVSLSSEFLEFTVKVRNNDPSVLPDPGKPFRISHLIEKAGIELADALLENTNVTYLDLTTGHYTKSVAAAMAKYVRTSKRLQHIRWNLSSWMMDNRVLQEKLLCWCCFLPAIQESASLKELDITFPIIGRPSNLVLENMLTHTQSLRSLSLRCPMGRENIAVAAARSRLKKNTTLREPLYESSH